MMSSWYYIIIIIIVIIIIILFTPDSQILSLSFYLRLTSKKQTLFQNIASDRYYINCDSN